MNHPKPEEWLRYVDEEGTAEMRGRLSEHLQQCSNCSAELEGWQRSVQKLKRLGVADKRQFAPKRPGIQFWKEPLLKWGIAALVILSLGFLYGRFSAQQASLKTLTQLKEELREQWQNDLFSAMRAEGTRSETSSPVSDRETIAHLQQSQDRLLTMIKSIQAQHIADYISLRQDLETAVSVADKDLRQSNLRINQLANTVLIRNE
jgi:anti-sigma factor RsiW